MGADDRSARNALGRRCLASGGGHRNRPRPGADGRHGSHPDHRHPHYRSPRRGRRRRHRRDGDDRGRNAGLGSLRAVGHPADCVDRCGGGGGRPAGAGGRCACCTDCVDGCGGGGGGPAGTRCSATNDCPGDINGIVASRRPTGHNCYRRTRIYAGRRGPDPAVVTYSGGGT